MDNSHKQIIEYDPHWVHIYKAESEKLKPVFGKSLVDIAHIGSTAIPGLASKPIIDIAALIKNHKEADKFIEPLENLGYIFDRELHKNTGNPERHFFRKGNPTRFHLSIAYADKAKFWPRQILFRDYLKEHPEDREEYGNLKIKLLEKDPGGIDTYISGKTEFVNKILKRAGFDAK